MAHGRGGRIARRSESQNLVATYLADGRSVAPCANRLREGLRRSSPRERAQRCRGGPQRVWRLPWPRLPGAAQYARVQTQGRFRPYHRRSIFAGASA